MVLRLNTRKILQRRSYDLLSHKYSFFFILIALVILVILSVQFGEVWMIWSQEKYESFFFSFSDNIKGISLQDKLCQNLPIDAVYTWVNGSDPLLMQNLLKYQAEMQDEMSRLCPYQNCVPSHIAVLRQIGTVPVNQIYVPETKKWINFETNYGKSNLVTGNRTLLYLSTTDEAATTVKFLNHLRNENLSVSHAHWTSDKSAPNAYAIYNSLIMSGIPMLSLQETKETLEALLIQLSGGKVINMWIHIAKKVIVVEFMSNEAASNIQKHFAGNLTFRGHNINITNAFLVFDLPPIGDPKDFSPSRFEDKEELRYSLRSLEKFAPWIRHVYLVTNGQIPYWLNLDNPRLTIITHNELFPNTSHLPTFSSPAIEAHLHRIPGLSSKFLYFNDDLILGKEVWPEDFITYANGQKVYFSWAVPDCSESCPWSWVNDGSCDLSCNISECFFDGGDCNPANMYIMDEGALYEDSQHVFDNINDNFDNTLNNEDNSDWLNHFINDKDLDTGGGERIRLDIPINQVMQDNFSEHQSFLIKSEGNSSSQNTSYINIQQQENVTLGKRFSNPNKFNISFLNMLQQEANKFPKINTDNQNPDLKTNLLEKIIHKNYTVHSYGYTNPNVRIHNISKSVTVIPAEYYFMSNNAVSNLSVASDMNFGRKNRKLFYSNIQKNLSDEDLRMGKPKDNQERVSHKFLLKSKRKHRLTSKINYRRKSYDRISDGNSYSLDIWRNKNVINKTENFQNNKSKYSHNLHYSSTSVRRYRDTFAESLLYVNGIYNKEFGFEARKVPAHMPHLIDQEIMNALQLRFKDEWALTSSHKIRSQNDMQYAFSYFYFLMSENKSVPVSDIFDTFDTDHSGTWSDREIRTLLTRLYGLPLVYNQIVYFEEKIINCSKVLPKEISNIDVPTPMYERYQDSKLPVVSKKLICNCKSIASLLKEKFGTIKKYKYDIVKDKYQDVSFKMLNSNLSQLISYLDDVRKQPKKFICLNDNFDPMREKDNVIARAILQDFYESLFPIPSSFELPAEFRNRFLHTSELKEWRTKRNFVKVFIFLCLSCLILFTLISFFQQECHSIQRKLFHFDPSTRRRVQIDI